jgi:hypothetical protein
VHHVYPTALRFHHGVGRLVRHRRFIDDVRILAALNAGRCFGMVVQGETTLRLRTRQGTPGSAGSQLGRRKIGGSLLLRCTFIILLCRGIFILFVPGEDCSRLLGSAAPHPVADKLISLFLRQVDSRRRVSPFAEASDPGGSRNGSTEMRS